MSALRLDTKYVEKPWGRFDIPAIFPNPEKRQIGEIWFDGPAGRHPPLLVKYIFTSEKLSIQVHPNDPQAQARGISGGKEECWYILDAEPGATLGVGLTRPLDDQALRDAALDGSIEAIMDWKAVRPGDFFFIPAGTVHAIGAGITLVEVQQNVDITYRLYDYGRPRELHLDDGVAVSKAAPYALPERNFPLGQDVELLAKGAAPFQLSLHNLAAGTTLDVHDSGPVWVIPLSGSGTIDGQSWGGSECWLVEGGATLTAGKTADILIATL